MANNQGSFSGLNSSDKPMWIERTYVFGDFSAAGLTLDFELFDLQGGEKIHGIFLIHTSSFIGGTISAVTMSVGIAGNLVKYAPAFDVFQAAGNTVFQDSEITGVEDFGSSTSIRLAATSVGANLDQLTQGVLEVRLLVSKIR